jgi:hypothetical protein
MKYLRIGAAMLLLTSLAAGSLYATGPSSVSGVQDVEGVARGAEQNVTQGANLDITQNCHDDRERFRRKQEETATCKRARKWDIDADRAVLCPDGKTVAILRENWTSNVTQIAFHDVAVGKKISEVSLKWTQRKPRFEAGGKILLVEDFDRTVRRINVRTGAVEVAGKLPGRWDDEEGVIAVSPNGKHKVELKPAKGKAAFTTYEDGEWTLSRLVGKHLLQTRALAVADDGAFLTAENVYLPTTIGEFG